jgi:Lrp/AsnC family transcriptional regulator, regulator for asnA, asnC and gidA
MLDKLDREIILRLQNDGRESNVKIAAALGVNERTIRKRLDKLLEKKVIKITAIPNLEYFGYDFIGIVGLQIQLLSLNMIKKTLIEQPNICYLANVAGQYDLIFIAIAKSARQFSDFMENVVSNIPGILRTETFVNLNLYKGETSGLDTSKLINMIQ